MKKVINKLKGKKVLSLFLALIMVLSVASPAVSQMFSVTAKAVESKFAVELGFNNLFLFEKWANNSLSSTVLVDGVPQEDKKTDGLEVDIENGSFTLTKTNMAALELFTAFSMDEKKAESNEDYYTIDVEPNTTYVFSYHVTGNTWSFTPTVFFFNSSGLFIGVDKGMVAYPTPNYNYNNFKFTTPADVTSIQIRFTIGDTSSNHPISGAPVGNSGAASVYATVKDIAIYEAELYDAYFVSQNMFSFADWDNNPYSSAPSTLSQTNGSVVTDAATGTITITNTSGDFWTGFGINTAASNDAYYTMAVNPSKSYTLAYDVTDISLPGAVHCQPWIVELDSEGKCVTFYQNDQNLHFGNNKWQFTCRGQNTARIQVVFSIVGVTAEASCKVSNIGVYETDIANSAFATVTGHTNRQYYPVGSTTYGTLPTPSYVPENQVFAGWYTGKNGAGDYISANTEISYESLTVYPKFEPAVDTLAIKTQPAKTTYTVGEKINTAGLVLTATQTYTVDVTDENGNVTGTETKTNTFDISSGYRIEPEYVTTAGEDQVITVSYGGKSVKLYVDVLASVDETVTVNGNSQTVPVANNKYTFDYSTTPFNRYELTYYSDCYVKGIITMDADTEEFFLEPSDNGSFASYIDGFLKRVQHYSVVSIEFTCLNKDFGNFELYSLTTINAAAPSESVQYYNNNEYKVGVDLAFGGVISYIENVKNGPIAYDDGTGAIKVDYAHKLGNPTGSKVSTSVNLINTKDRGRYLQQSYYGTDQPPFEMGSYNGVPWNYNPVQGGNLPVFDAKTGEVIKGNESSKVIDYRITDKQIYVKTRPLDWGKNSDDYADSYNTPSYMEAWYTFEGDLIKASCRYVDYSGYPSNYTTQEMPALYTIEPLNHYVYNNVTAENAWKTDTGALVQQNVPFYSLESEKVEHQENKLVNVEEPEFWGILPSYNKYNPTGEVDPNVDCYENWAAFTASADADSFGIGVYSAGVTNFHYGCFPAKYEENQYKAAGEQDAVADGGYIKALKEGTQASYKHVKNNKHAITLDPASEDATSYIAPVGEMTFESYKPITYDFYVSTGTAAEIREDFRRAANDDAQAEYDKTKIAVPETVYMTPASDASTKGQIYVNNILDSSNYYNIETLAEPTDNMYFGLHVKDAKSFTVTVSNVTPEKGGAIYLGDVVGSAGVNYNGKTIDNISDTYEIDNTWGLHFSGTGLKPGEKTTAKWEITVTKADGTKETHVAYTVMYAPQRTVGAVAEARRTTRGLHEQSSWITGANGVDHSLNSPLGTFYGAVSASGYFKEDPLVYSAPLTGITSNNGTANDLIYVATTDAEKYVMQTAQTTYDSSFSQSYLGKLAVDASRYTNTNQIPNFKIGYDALRIGSYTKDSFHTYNSYYTLGEGNIFQTTDITAVPSGWSELDYIANDAHNSNFAAHYAIPYRETVVPSYNISGDIDGKYIHALNRAQCIQDTFGIVTRSYSSAATSVLIDVTNKSELRDAVLEGYNQTNTNPEFDEALEKAATVLGDPSATQDEIDAAKKDLNNAMEEYVETFYALKYDNLFSAYEMNKKPASMKVAGDKGIASWKDGTITVVNGNITGGEAYTEYGSADSFYKVALKPNTEYVFEYDVTTDVKAQAFMFFYKADGSAGDKPTNMSVQTNGGEWATKSENNAWFGNYTNSAGSYHYAIKFTTGANTTQASFRFGNTSNDPTTSTFSNIRLIDSAHYYEDVQGYTKTEDVYKEYASYGTLPTLSRTGYTFEGWSDENDVGITGATIATEHRTIYSQWNEHTYTIVYNANGGSGSIASQVVGYSTSVTLPDSGFTKTGYKLVGWSTTSGASSADYAAGQTVSALTAENGKTVTLYAVWAKSDINVTFDNLFDLSKFNISTSQLIVDSNNTGFVITAKENASDANTGWSEYIAVEPGKTYIFSADVSFEQASGGYDMYIHTVDSNKAGETSAIPDTSNGARREGDVYISLTGQTNNGKKYIRFTAGETTKYIRVRFDANNAGNKLTVSNIRIWEDDGVVLDTANKIVGNGNQYGTLPEPTRKGYTFIGWKNAAGDWVEATDVMNSEATVNLYSQWKEIVYTVNYSTNGPDGATGPAVSGKTYTYPDTITLPGAYSWADGEFLGWSTNQYATKAEYAVGSSVDVSEIIDKANGENTITIHAVWRLKDSVLVEDNVVVDFGLPITFAPFGNDSSVLFYHAVDTKMTSGYEIAFEGAKYGNFVYDYETGVTTYTATKPMLSAEEVAFKVTLNYVNGAPQTLTGSIVIAPASNVYYEETVFENVSYGTAVWSTVEAGISEGYSDNTDSVYGFDNAYNNTNTYSNGTALFTAVDSTKKLSAGKKFTFVGDGVDIISACGPQTGIQIIDIKNAETGRYVTSVIVDTYYAGSDFSQVPIFSWRGDYGKYIVETSAAYLSSAGALNATKGVKKSNLIDTGLVMNSSDVVNTASVEAMLEAAGVERVDVENIELVWFDDNSILNGGTGVAANKKGARSSESGNVVLNNYLDGFRVYNTLNEDSSAYADSEKKASYVSVINNLAAVGDYLDGIGFITGSLAEGEKLSFANYQSVGPKDEFYLLGEQGLTFKLKVNAGEKVMLGLRAVNGETTIDISSNKSDTVIRGVAINSATEMFYDITECLGAISADGTEVHIAVRNTGTNMLAINQVKLSGGANINNGNAPVGRSIARSGDATAKASTAIFLPLTTEDLFEVENSFATKEAVNGEVVGGVVMPIIEDEGDEPNSPEGNEPDAPEGDEPNTPEGEEPNTPEGDEPNVPDNSGSENGASEEFSIFSLLRMLLALIENILRGAFGSGNLV